MKRLFVCTSLLLVAATLSAQTAPPKAPPKSPAATESATIVGANITITYHAPGVKGRAGQIFTKDGLISHDPTYPVWRAGANEATKLHTDSDIMIGKLLVPKGDYTLWVDVADPDNWILIINKQTSQWGTKYDKAQDLGFVKMTTAKTPATVENLKYTLKNEGGNKGKLSLDWENRTGSVSIVVK